MPAKPHHPALALAALVAACAAPSLPPTAEYALGEAPGPQTLTALRRDDPLRAPAIGTTRIMLGLQQLDEDFWEPIDRLPFLGMETSYENTGDWIGFEWGGAVSFGDDSMGVDDPSPGSELVVDIEFYEVYAGVYRSFLRGAALRPYVGAGVSVIFFDGEKKLREPGQPTVEDDRDDFTLGFYAHGGLAYQFSENFQVGIDLRALVGTDADNIFGDGDVDYERASLFIGFGG